MAAVADIQIRKFSGVGLHWFPGEGLPTANGIAVRNAENVPVRTYIVCVEHVSGCDVGNYFIVRELLASSFNIR